MADTASAAAPHLCGIPLELKSIICNKLERRRDARNLACTCKALKDCALASLYKCVDISFMNGHQVRRFLQQRPELQHIRHLRVSYSHIWPSSREKTVISDLIRFLPRDILFSLVLEKRRSQPHLLDNPAPTQPVLPFGELALLARLQQNLREWNIPPLSRIPATVGVEQIQALRGLKFVQSITINFSGESDERAAQFLSENKVLCLPNTTRLKRFTVIGAILDRNSFDLLPNDNCGLKLSFLEAHMLDIDPPFALTRIFKDMCGGFLTELILTECSGIHRLLAAFRHKRSKGDQNAFPKLKKLDCDIMHEADRKALDEWLVEFEGLQQFYARIWFEDCKFPSPTSIVHHHATLTVLVVEHCWSSLRYSSDETLYSPQELGHIVDKCKLLTEVGIPLAQQPLRDGDEVIVTMRDLWAPYLDLLKEIPRLSVLSILAESSKKDGEQEFAHECGATAGIYCSDWLVRHVFDAIPHLDILLTLPFATLDVFEHRHVFGPVDEQDLILEPQLQNAYWFSDKWDPATRTKKRLLLSASAKRSSRLFNPWGMKQIVERSLIARRKKFERRHTRCVYTKPSKDV